MDQQLALDLNGDLYRDKTLGCWAGKNAGGTLGTPLEKTFGEEEPFDVWWYPELREGGIPNDDLEIQLIWLKALEEVGPGLTARELSRYWLDNIGYNFDEYGLSKTNLRLGLEPPVSGYYNNWFKDCMGCPIRSEIWACVAPGVPRLAVRYAYEDAICDHAGGESVYGELFNAAVESAAFVVGDVDTLIDIGLSYIPGESLTAAAIKAARQAHADGHDWLQARRKVMDATPHYVAQYSPINLGFQVIGLLYGTDFGDGICKTVNCGYDTDSSGASIGSYLGILQGLSGLPKRWIEPLGDDIATNESWGGVRHMYDGANPVPKSLDDLIDRIRRAALAVLGAAGKIGPDGVVRVSTDELYADESVAELWSASPTTVGWSLTDVDVAIDYLDTPAVVAGTAKSVEVSVRNVRVDPLELECRIVTPAGWNAPASQVVRVEPGAEERLQWIIEVPDRSVLRNRNELAVALSPKGRPALSSVPLVLVGAAAYRVSELQTAPPGMSEEELLDVEFEPERHGGDGREGAWREISVLENVLPLGDIFDKPGVQFVQTYLHVDEDTSLWLGVDANCPVKVLVDDRELARDTTYRRIRPNYHGKSSTYAKADLSAGWHEVLLKLVRGDEALPAECHVLLSSADVLHHGQPQVGRTQYPWDVT